MQKVKYNISPTLLDSFSWYKRDESENAKQDLINKINRVKSPPTDAMLRGIEFERIISMPILPDDDIILVHDEKCTHELVRGFHKHFKYALQQQFVEGIVNDVRLYGYVDFLLKDTAYDVKTTGTYTFPKYNTNWQRIVYLKCFQDMGVDVPYFEYRITDFKNWYSELYTLTEKDEDNLKTELSEFVEFIELNKHLITDRKIIL